MHLIWHQRYLAAAGIILLHPCSLHPDIGTALPKNVHADTKRTSSGRSHLQPPRRPHRRLSRSPGSLSSLLSSVSGRPDCVRPFSLCPAVQSVSGRPVCVRPFSLCPAVQSVSGRPVCVRPSSLSHLVRVGVEGAAGSQQVGVL